MPRAGCCRSQASALTGPPRRGPRGGHRRPVRALTARADGSGTTASRRACRPPGPRRLLSAPCPRARCATCPPLRPHLDDLPLLKRQLLCSVGVGGHAERVIVEQGHEDAGRGLVGAGVGLRLLVQVRGQPVSAAVVTWGRVGQNTASAGSFLPFNGDTRARRDPNFGETKGRLGPLGRF